MSNQSPTERAISAAGGVNALARALGRSHPTIVGWKRRGIPPERLLEVAAVTGMSPADLRPDLAEIFQSGGGSHALPGADPANHDTENAQ